MSARLPRIVIVGGEGLLGRALRRRAAGTGVQCLSLSRSRADLRRPFGLQIALDRAGPDVVVNAAAYTDVDRAEADVETAFAVNRDGAANLARICAERELPLLHLSTDYVFGDGVGRPRTEGDRTGPLGIYGASKLAGEIAVRRMHPGATVLRTAWLYDEVQAGFVQTMLSLAGQRDHLRVVADQTGSPTHVDDLADGLVALARRAVAGDAPLGGVYHLAGASGVSRHDWIAALLDVYAAVTGRRVAIEAVPSSAFPTPARRPFDSSLDCARIARDHGVRLPDWAERLEATVRHGLAGLSASA